MMRMLLTARFYGDVHVLIRNKCSFMSGSDKEKQRKSNFMEDKIMVMVEETEARKNVLFR